MCMKLYIGVVLDIMLENQMEKKKGYDRECGKISHLLGKPSRQPHVGLPLKAKPCKIQDGGRT